MELLAQINIPRSNGNAVIQLLLGDLSAIPAEHAVDILVVSAFPNDYTPLKGSLFLALKERGLSMKELAANKKTDLVPQLGCWISQTLSNEQQQLFNFKRILCFEPQQQSAEPQSVVGNIFRCINTFAFDDDNDEVAMPILATGYQRIPLEKMLPALLDSAAFWLGNGLPLRCIKFVLHSQEKADIALSVFERYENPSFTKQFFSEAGSPKLSDNTTGVTEDYVTRQPVKIPRAPAAEPYPAFTAPSSEPKPQPGVVSDSMYDYFISYSHKQQDEVKAFVNAFLEKRKDLNIFYDRTSIPSGGLWLKKISEAIQHAKCVVCVLTPEYITSDVCWDEFQCAKVMELRTKKNIIKTINFINDDNMPPMMAIYNYIDCTEADLEKLKKSVDQLI
ncbi:MAG: toll/interleukin-1 receptor domain-containing protein [Agriterribacter sp.]